MRLSGSVEALCVVVLTFTIVLEAEAICTADYCSNGGTCYPVAYSGQDYRHCDCFGLTHAGYQCGIPINRIQRCPSNHIGYNQCLHNSHCYYDPFNRYNNWQEFNKGFYCHCQQGFWGDYCQHSFCRGLTVIKNCKSKKNKFKKCKVANSQYRVTSVQVLKVKSSAGCVYFPGLPIDFFDFYGAYGYYDNFIWVINNCKGQLQVCVELANDFCHNSPCIHGICVNGQRGYTCTCNPGYFGTNCDRVDYCHNSPCLHGGICTRGNNGYTCNCAGTGYYGSRCHQVDYCHNSPCLHGGICIRGNSGYTCNCAGTGYYGSRCHQVDYCHNSPCLHGGICIRGNNGYTCNCAGTGYYGSRCHQVDYCHNHRCVHGVCNRLSNGYNCVCTGTGYYGTYCHLVDYCHSRPCRHGVCHIYQNSGYYCDCANTGYYGTNCHLVNYCYYNPCGYYGVCYLYGNGYYCVCRGGYYGSTCQYRGGGSFDDDDFGDDRQINGTTAPLLTATDGNGNDDEDDFVGDDSQIDTTITPLLTATGGNTNDNNDDDDDRQDNMTTTPGN